ncbi:hypothetical protein BJ912DRAFT_924729 [Pholiota molesta]|nr:hypothetical protein BJ912DRAFT_924729 [Pholiota molesta]
MFYQLKSLVFVTLVSAMLMTTTIAMPIEGDGAEGSQSSSEDKFNAMLVICELPSLTFMFSEINSSTLTAENGQYNVYKGGDIVMKGSRNIFKFGCQFKGSRLAGRY